MRISRQCATARCHTLRMQFALYARGRRSCVCLKREITVKIFFDISRFMKTNFPVYALFVVLNLTVDCPRLRARGDRHCLEFEFRHSKEDGIAPAYFFTFTVLTLLGRGRKYNLERIRSARGRYSV